MSLTRRTLLSLPVAIPLLNLAARTAVGDDLYFPPPDAQGGWRTLSQPSEDSQAFTGIDKSRLDEPSNIRRPPVSMGAYWFSAMDTWSTKNTSAEQTGKPIPTCIHRQDVYQRLLWRHAVELGSRFPERVIAEGLHPAVSAAGLSLSYPEMADIRLGHLLTMTSGLRNSRTPLPAALPNAGHLTGIIHGENVNIPYWTSPGPGA